LSGIYFHIPYCQHACTYCNFHFSTSLKTKSAVLGAMKKEMEIRSTSWEDELSTIYFGGGTPSILTPTEFSDLIIALGDNFDLSKVEEFTIECNPEDLVDDKLEAWKKAGVTRLSIGIQSFQDPILKTINRHHTAEEAIAGVERARKFYFENISLDLIVGLPGLSNELLRKDLDQLLALDLEHISVYQLTLEEKTQLAHQVKKGEVELLSDDVINQQYLLTHEILSNNGFDHYEISNYSKPGFTAVHNSSYWKGISYLGIGPGAHSFRDNERIWNVANNIGYTNAIEKGDPWYEGENLEVKDQFNEFIMISLRTKEGLNLNEMKSKFPSLYSDELEINIDNWVVNKLAFYDDINVKLTLKGWLISDDLASDLFVL